MTEQPSQVVIGSLARADDYQRILADLKATGNGPVSGEMVDRILDNGEYFCRPITLESMAWSALPTQDPPHSPPFLQLFYTRSLSL